ncbi:MAG: hypothetical protein JSV19_12795 [Phycisphaerales bacterium]|nr:MAG: hypothetical protein JSV19_12795 [Phycisphaerales bacterium]
MITSATPNSDRAASYGSDDIAAGTFPTAQGEHPIGTRNPLTIQRQNHRCSTVHPTAITLVQRALDGPPSRHAVSAACLLLLAAAGCGGDARVELSAATAIEQVAASVAVAMEEYHREVTAADDRREDAVVRALVERIRRDHQDEKATDAHVADFHQAMRHVRQDRDTEWRRYVATGDNLSVLTEITSGLRRLAVESMTLSDEARRYLRDVIDARLTHANARTPDEENHANGD